MQYIGLLVVSEILWEFKQHCGLRYFVSMESGNWLAGSVTGVILSDTPSIL